jgi:hypothetical protein
VTETYTGDRAKLIAAIRDFCDWPAPVLAMVNEGVASDRALKKPIPYEGVTPAQARVLEAFEEAGPRCTWTQIAEKLGCHVGTVRRHVMDVKARNPAAYERWRNVRRHQLTERHQRSEKRRKRHSAIYFIKLNRR